MNNSKSFIYVDIQISKDDPDTFYQITDLTSFISDSLESYITTSNFTTKIQTKYQSLKDKILPDFEEFISSYTQNHSYYNNLLLYYKKRADISPFCIFKIGNKFYLKDKSIRLYGNSKYPVVELPEKYNFLGHEN